MVYFWIFSNNIYNKYHNNQSYCIHLIELIFKYSKQIYKLKLI